MADLHARLTAAVNARLEVARAAGTDWGRQWMISRVEPYTDPVVLGSSDDESFKVVGTVDVEVPEQIHIAANDPATVIRHCERDLKALERHHPDPGDTLLGVPVGVCADHQIWTRYPCDDIKDLATAYEVEYTE